MGAECSGQNRNQSNNKENEKNFVRQIRINRFAQLENTTEPKKQTPVLKYTNNLQNLNNRTKIEKEDIKFFEMPKHVIPAKNEKNNKEIELKELFLKYKTKPNLQKEKTPEAVKNKIPEIKKEIIPEKAKDAGLIRIHRCICESFEVALLEKDIKNPSQREKFFTLDDLLQDKQRNNEPILFCLNDIPVIIETKLHILNEDGLILYLCDTYKNIKSCSIGLNGHDTFTIQEYISRAGLLLINETDNFYSTGGKLKLSKEWFSVLIEKSAEDTKEFLNSIIEEIIKHENGHAILEDFIKIMHKILLLNLCKLRSEDDQGKWISTFGAILILINKKECAEILMKIEMEIYNTSSYSIEYMSVLGNILRFSLFPCNTLYGANCFEKNKANFISMPEVLKKTRESLTNSIEMITKKGHAIILKLLKVHNLNEILQWLSLVGKRSASKPSDSVASIGFLFNLLWIVLKICNIYTADQENYNKYAVLASSSSFPNNNERINEICCPLQIIADNDNFISQTFALAHQIMGLCIGIIRDTINGLLVQDKLEKNEENWFFFFSYCSHLLSSEFVKLITDFLVFSNFVILSTLKPCTSTIQNYLKNEIVFPFPMDIPINCGNLPGKIITNIQDCFECYLLSGNDGFFLINPIYLPLMTRICMIFLSMPYMTNSNLQGKFTKYFGELAEKNELLTIVHNDDFFKNYLFKTFINGFIFMEKVTEVQDINLKFKYRNNLIQLLILEWKNNETFYNKRLEEILDKLDEFHLFCDFLLNDFCHLHDEILIKLEEIKNIEEELIIDDISNTLHFETRKGKEKVLYARENNAITLIKLLNGELELIKYFTSYSPKIFLHEELGEKFICNLNYYLMCVMQNTLLIKCRNIDTFNLSPLNILKQIIEIYANEADCSECIKILSKENNLFPELFPAIEKKLREENILIDLNILNRFYKLGDKVLFTDAPIQFKDALTHLVMNEPVLLPSGKICDLSTIKKRLISNPTDPFTKQLLTIDMLVNCPELKKQIEEYKSQKK